MKRFLPSAVILLACGCGYVGEPQPPLLNIPVRIEKVQAIQRGGTIFVQVPAPRLSTEGVVLRKPPRVDLRVGPAREQFNADEWAASALAPSPVSQADGVLHYEVPINSWAGKEVVLGARAVGANGRESGWSEFLVLAVVPPPQPPAGVRAEVVKDGVQLTWDGAGSRFRIYRQGPADKESILTATVETHNWTDTATEYGKAYQYSLQALVRTPRTEAESVRSELVRIVPEDRFPPAAPLGLTAVPSTGSIELAWDRNTEPDLAGYIVYRAAAGGAFAKLTNVLENPSYSDRKLEPRQTYRYAVTAIDRKGNESGKSGEVEAFSPGT